MAGSALVSACPLGWCFWLILNILFVLQQMINIQQLRPLNQVVMLLGCGVPGSSWVLQHCLHSGSNLCTPPPPHTL